MSISYISIVDEASSLTIVHKRYILDISYQIQPLMKEFFQKNRRFRERLTKTKEQILKTIQLFNTTALQQMNEKEKKKKNEKIISVDEKLAKNVKMKKIIKKRFLKKEENSNTMIFDIINVKNLNVEIFMKYHTDDTTTTSSNFTKFFFEFESFLKEESAAQAYEKE